MPVVSSAVVFSFDDGVGQSHIGSDKQQQDRGCSEEVLGDTHSGQLRFSDKLQKIAGIEKRGAIPRD
jgi:hypothetical protein